MVNKWTLREGFYSKIGNHLFIEEMFDHVPDIVFSIKDLEGRYIFMSQSCVDRCNIKSKEEAIGKKAHDLFPASMADRYTEQDKYVFSTGKPVSDNLDVTPYFDGSLGWCVSTKTPIYDSEGNIMGLSCISKDINLPHKNQWVDDDLSKTVDYIQSNYKQSLKVQQLADIAGVSVAQLERRMKKVYKITIGQFINKTRIDAVATLLINTKKSIAEISNECGFYDQSALSRHFKSMTGMTPRDYRESMRRNRIKLKVS